MNNKGQTALEYLITYGWAILVILVVLAVLWYYNIFNPAAWGGPQVISGTSFLVLDYSLQGAPNITTNSTMAIVLGNKGPAPLNITNLAISGDLSGADNNAGAGWLLTGAGNITISDIGLSSVGSGQTVSFTILMTYDNKQTGLTDKGDTLTFNNIVSS